MTDERKLEILDRLLSWISYHDKEFVESAINAMNLSRDEMDELELNEYIEEEEIYKLKYLLSKETCCGLDKEETFILEELIQKYGYPD